jgi:hypothetical protein
MNAYRVNIINTLQLIADNQSQLEYQNEVPFVSVATEMCCQWFDDFYHPNAIEFSSQFTTIELAELDKFTLIFSKYVDSLPESLPELHRHSGWFEISTFAKSVLLKLNWLNVEAKYD